MLKKIQQIFFYKKNAELWAMEKRTSINASLGLTQEELSQLLGITRSKWSMYELGIGRLPPAASKLLGELFAHVATAEKTSKPRPQIIQQQVMTEQLTRLLKKNHFQSLLAEKKIALAEKKYAKQRNLLSLVGVLKKQKQDASNSSSRFLKLLGDKTSEAQEAHALLTLFQLQVRQQMLALEKELLEKQMNSLGTDSK